MILEPHFAKNTKVPKKNFKIGWFAFDETKRFLL